MRVYLQSCQAQDGWIKDGFVDRPQWNRPSQIAMETRSWFCHFGGSRCWMSSSPFKKEAAVDCCYVRADASIYWWSGHSHTFSSCFLFHKCLCLCGCACSCWCGGDGWSSQTTHQGLIYEDVSLMSFIRPDHFVLIKGSGFECMCSPWTSMIVVQSLGFWWTRMLSPTEVSEESRWISAVVSSRKAFQQSHFDSLWFSACVSSCIHEADMFVLPATVDTAQFKQLLFLSFILPQTILKIFLCFCEDEEDFLLPTSIRCSSAFEATPAHLSLRATPSWFSSSAYTPMFPGPR